MCAKCERQTHYECLICGSITKNSKQTCSENCSDAHGRMQQLQKIGILPEQSNAEDLFSGEILSIWRDENKIFLSFAYPGVIISFDDDTAFGKLLEDFIDLSHDLTCEMYDADE